MTTITTETKKRIMKEAMLIRVQTVFGTAVTVSKKQACQLLDILERRAVKPIVSFDEVRPGKFLVVIDGQV